MKTDSIVIVGGGSSGWMTAATLIKEFPNKKITVIESKDYPIIGVGESTLGGFKRWSHFIGIEEKDFFPETDASYKLSIKFTDFYKKGDGGFYYPFGNPLTINRNNIFSDWHYKKYFFPETDLKDFTRCLFPSSYLFENNKFSENKYYEFDNFNFKTDAAYHFDAIKFGQWLKNNVCLNKGVKLIQSTVKDVVVGEDGVECLILDNEDKIYADLFVDCTGFKGLLIGESLKEKFIDYSEMLPNNRAWATRLSYKNKEEELQGYTNCTAIENGWCWNIPLWSRLGTGYVYSDKFVSPEQAKQEFKNYLMSEKMVIPRTREEVEKLDFKDIKMRVGIYEKTFVKNVVAIGLSAGFIEPLESNGLFSVHEFLFKLIDILQRGEISQFDRDMYNVSVFKLFNGFAKFVALHYALSHRNDTEYWKSINRKVFVDDGGDPFAPYIGKSAEFYDVSWRFFENWDNLPPHVINAGIVYISTGMGLIMKNNHRFMLEQTSSNLDIKKDVEYVINVWEKNKEKWKINANNSLSLYKYLEKNFYS